VVVVAACLGAGASGWAAIAPGPDAFGYTATTTSSFTFTNITNGFKALSFDDDAAVTVSIGFSFNFYGSNYSTVSFNPNGFMTFGGTSTDWTNVNLTVSAPRTNLPSIAALWCDYETESVGADAVYYKTIGAMGSRQFIVQWNQVMLVPGVGTDTITFQARLLEGNNRMVFSYLDVVVSDDPAYSNGAFATVGIRDRDGQLNGRNLLWSHKQAVITNGLHILIAPSNHPPVAVNDVVSTLERMPVIINVLANDSDPDGNRLIITSATPGTNGTTTMNGGTNVTYSPGSTYSPRDTFTYTVSDGEGGAATGMVQVTIVAVNDPPTATNDQYEVDEDTLLVVAAPGVLGNDGDPDGDSLTAVLVANALHGLLTLQADGSFTYQPGTNFNGVDGFTYRASDGILTSSNATVAIVVRPVNDPPLALGDAETTLEDTAVAVTLRAFDVDGDPLTFSIEQPPAHGSLSGVAPALIYQPQTNFAGNDSFLYVVDDGHGSSATGTVFITVTPVDDGPPVASPDFADTYQHVPLLLSVETLLANDMDVDPEDIMTITEVSPSSQAGANLTLTNDVVFYLSPTNFTGLDAFDYVVVDGNGGSATGLVHVTVWSSLRIASIQADTNGTVRLLANSIPGRTNCVEATGDWTVWDLLGCMQEDPPGRFRFEDSTATNYPMRFYRLREQ
jgi:VCBS repeat-containing protein